MKEYLKKIIEDFNSRENDTERFRFLLEHPGVFMLHLDNDSTHLGLTEGSCKNFTDEEVENFVDMMNGFDGWLGHSEGVISLLETIGIKGEPV